MMMVLPDEDGPNSFDISTFFIACPPHDSLAQNLRRVGREDRETLLTRTRPERQSRHPILSSRPGVVARWPSQNRHTFAWRTDDDGHRERIRSFRRAHRPLW